MGGQEGNADQRKVDERVYEVDQQPAARFRQAVLDQARRIAEFDARQLADGQQHREQQDDVRDRRRSAEDQQQQNAGRESAAEQVHDERRRRLLVRLFEQAMVQVVLVAVHDSAGMRVEQLAHAAPPDREDHVEKRHADGQQRQQQRGRGHGMVDRRKADDREDQSEKRAAGVAEKNPGRIEVVTQESEAGAGQNQHGDRLRVVSADQQEPDRHAAARDDRESRSESVEPVDQVE